MKQKTILILLIMVAILVAALSAFAAENEDATPVFQEETAVQRGSGIVVEPKDAVGPAIYMVILADMPVTRYDGSINGLNATSAAASDTGVFNIDSAESQAYMTHLDQVRAEAISEAEVAIGRPLAIQFEYRATLNGYAAEMTPAEAATIAKQANVAFVERERMFELQTDAGPAWIGAPGIWDGSATGDAGTKGEGIIVGVIDTGIDPWNPSFAATGDDGYTHTNPKSGYLGVCDPTNTSPPAGEVAYDSTFPCNDKLIGVYGYTASDPNPRDGDGHGSHTASTAAGNYVEDTTIETPTDTYTATISGVALHANIIMYDGCIDGGGCPGASLSAARDQLLLDGVDVVNYSIGSGSPTADPWTDTEALQWLSIRDAGIFVATSAGNAGPGDATLGSPGDLPWLTSVAAGSHNRAFLQELTLTDGVQTPVTLEGEAMTAGLGATPIVFASDYVTFTTTLDPEDARLCADGVFPPGTFSGEIVVCERGVYGRVAKGQTVKDGGAGGYILAQPDEIGGGPGSISSDPHVLPAIHIDYATYQQLLAFVNASTGTVSGAFSGATLDVADSHGDVMASFSSRGPNGGFFSDLIVPNVMAPGRSIWAAYHQGVGGDGDYSWNVIGGTSMASPHVAGSGALLKAANPDWTPAQIESALVSTAVTDVLDDDGVSQASPFAMGGGRVDLVAAVQAGLVLDESTINFENSDPRTGGDPTTLNLAQLSNSNCVQSCSWTRTFSSTLGTAQTYTLTLDLPTGVTGTVTPSSITVGPYATQMITVEVNVLGATEEWHFGSLEMDAASASVPDMHLPLAVQPNTGDLPESVSLVTRRNAGSELVTGLTSIEITDLTVEAFGLVKGEEHLISLEEDSTNADAFDDLMDPGVYYMTVNVPADAKRLVAEIYESEAPDIDLFVGTGTTPSAATQVCASATGSYTEYCDITDPAAGDWWILVQNWESSATPPYAVLFGVAVVEGDEGNMTVEGPTAVDALDPFDIRVFWDEDTMTAGDRWYGGFTLGTNAANPGNIGYVSVDLYRAEDDVVKTASVPNALPGDVLTYTITVNPNILGEDLTYYLTDTLPAGLTYLPGSASATAGTVSYASGKIYWNGSMISPVNEQPSYTVTTSDTDASCDTGFGGYVNLQGFGIFTQAGITGDTDYWTAFSTANPVTFYGETYSGIGFSDDGFAIFAPATNYGGSPWVPQSLPNSALPNNVAAILWDDFEIFYDAALNHGVSLATAGPDTSIIEYDNIQYWGGSADQFDFEMVTTHTPDATPGVYEIVFAYDNISGTLPSLATIGLETAAGDYADVLLNAGNATGVISDGFMVCFDQDPSALEPVEITYQVIVNGNVDLGTVLENTVASTVSNPGSAQDQTSESILVLDVVTELYLPVVFKD